MQALGTDARRLHGALRGFGPVRPQKIIAPSRGIDNLCRCLYGNDALRKLSCECFRYVPVSKAPSDIAGTVIISPTLGTWLDAVASVKIIHCIARAAPTAPHGNFDNMRKIPLERFVPTHPPKAPAFDWHGRCYLAVVVWSMFIPAATGIVAVSNRGGRK